MSAAQIPGRTLGIYLCASYILQVFVFSGYMQFSSPITLPDWYFLFACIVTYPAIFMLPITMFCWLVFRWPRLHRLPQIWIPALIFFSSLLSLTVYGDVRLFDLYGFHINPFVINLLTTPGGIDSLGSGTNTLFALGWLVVGALLIHTMLLIAANLIPATLKVTKKPGIVMLLILVSIAVSERLIYGLADINNSAVILNTAQVIPLYNQVRFRTLAKKLGVDLVTQEAISIKQGRLNLQYPSNTIKFSESTMTPNIIWLVSESLRSDMLSEKIMPKTFSRSAKGWRLVDHYSGGNGTRQGLFALFYGIYGSYWDAFLRERKGPVLIDLLLDRNYEMNMYTSAGFTYPEFDQTLFTNMHQENLHQFNDDSSAVERDILNTDSIVEVIKNAPTDKPFMAFMFYESTHARYSFPVEDAIKVPYLAELNYATMSRESLALNIEALKNRYINASHFVDGQMERVFEELDRQAMWGNTIVMVAGDHGEEFMENGFWGHNSGFSEQQIKTPMVMWLPNKEPRLITYPTSHMDITATLLPILGVSNDSADYTQGIDLNKPIDREFIVVSDWSGVCFISDHYKFTLPFNSSLASSNKLFDQDDKPLTDLVSFFVTHRGHLNDIIGSTKMFLQRSHDSKL